MKAIKTKLVKELFLAGAGEAAGHANAAEHQLNSFNVGDEVYLNGEEGAIESIDKETGKIKVKLSTGEVKECLAGYCELELKSGDTGKMPENNEVQEESVKPNGMLTFKQFIKENNNIK